MRVFGFWGRNKIGNRVYLKEFLCKQFQQGMIYRSVGSGRNNRWVEFWRIQNWVSYYYRKVWRDEGRKRVFSSWVYSGVVQEEWILGVWLRSNVVIVSILGKMKEEEEINKFIYLCFYFFVFYRIFFQELGGESLSDGA